MTAAGALSCVSAVCAPYVLVRFFMVQERKKESCFVTGTIQQIAAKCNSIPTCKGFIILPVPVNSINKETLEYLKNGNNRTSLPAGGPAASQSDAYIKK